MIHPLFENEPDDIRRKKQEITYLEFHVTFLDALGIARRARKVDSTVQDDILVEDWMRMLNAETYNADLDWDDPRKAYTMGAFVQAATGITGFDALGHAIIHPDAIVRPLSRSFVGNEMFQDMANAHFQENYSVTVPFTGFGTVPPSHISVLSPSIGHSHS